MAGGDLSRAIASIPSVLSRTHFGAIWIGRFVLLALALAISRVAAPAARTASLALALAVTATTSLTGHAADQGDFTPTVAIDWVHVMAVSAWTGGLLCLALSFLGPARDWSVTVLGRVMRRFSRLAGLCLLAAVVTGAYNTWTELGGFADLWTTVYGRALSVKLALFLGLAWWGAVNRYSIVPRLGAGRGSGIGQRVFRLGRLALRGPARRARQALPARLRANVALEAVLVLLILVCTAVLVDSTPARHAGHDRHQALVEPGPFRVTMENLHESGGVPPGWIIVPPDGDAARGREVFIRQACYTCHRIKGEKLPPTSGPGPDLTGVGRHHPAGYLLESILNPNAVIVEGRGYTRPDGTSIMPALSEQVPVSDLVDLVAYLKSR